MNKNIQTFNNLLYDRNILNKEQIIIEAIRIFKIKRYLDENNITILEKKEDKENLFEIMNDISQKENIGFFPGDRDFFFELFDIAKNIDLIELVLETYKNDRLGIFIINKYLTDYIIGVLEKNKPATILFTEAEKYIIGLRDFIHKFEEIHVTLTSENFIMYQLLKTEFAEFDNVEVVNLSIYRDLPFTKYFDCIFSIPSFGGKFTDKDIIGKFITKDTEGIAIENLVKYLSPKGVFYVITPARLTFSGGSTVTLRKWLIENFNIDFIYTLPEGIFRPYTGIKTYFLAISKQKKDLTSIGNIIFQNNILKCSVIDEVIKKDFVMHEDWRVELYLPRNQDDIQKFKKSKVKKVKLKDISEIFRGKSIMKDDIKPGEFFVLNISNIEEGEVNYDNIETIDEEERKLKRYFLEKGDLVITCRGTVNKIAVFGDTDKKVIASANIIVIRLKPDANPHFIKLFIESPLGEMLLKTFQRGSVIMNINPIDIGELEIPLPDLEKQQLLVNKYNSEYKNYKEALQKLNENWSKQKIQIYESILEN